MKIAVITDVHANLPALTAALEAIVREGVDLIVHAGDAIAIGPQPAECLAMLLAQPNIRFVMGNHDAWFAHGLPQPQPKWMSDGEVAHQRWTHAQLDPDLREVVAAWPMYLPLDLDGVTSAFVHYALDASGTRLRNPMREPTAEMCDEAFGAYNPAGAVLIFYGHSHAFSDIQGRARYVNPGALGCDRQAVARYSIAEFHRGAYDLRHHAVPFDDAALFAAFEDREVPERQFIYKAFLGGRFA